jgi:DNA-binding Xre family transcriptional regulator
VGKRGEEVICIISYKPLFKLLLEKDMTKTQLRESVGFSTSTLAKMSKNEYVSLEIIDSICLFLDCKIENVVKIERNQKS